MGRDVPGEILSGRDFWKELKENPSGLAAEVCSIDLSDLQTTLERHAALRAWFGAAYETSKVQEARADWIVKKVRAETDLRVKRVSAEVYLIAKASPDPHSGKNKTVDTVRSEVDASPELLVAVSKAAAEVEEAQEALFEAQTVRAGLRAIADALADRRDMLIQLAAKLREESREYS